MLASIDTGKIVAELTVSKEDNKPTVIQVLVIMIAARLAVNSRSVAKYSDQNTGVRVEEPKGIDKS